MSETDFCAPVGALDRDIVGSVRCSRGPMRCSGAVIRCPSIMHVVLQRLQKPIKFGMEAYCMPLHGAAENMIVSSATAVHGRTKIFFEDGDRCPRSLLHPRERLQCAVASARARV